MGVMMLHGFHRKAGFKRIRLAENRRIIIGVAVDRDDLRAEPEDLTIELLIGAVIGAGRGFFEVADMLGDDGASAA